MEIAAADTANGSARRRVRRDAVRRFSPHTAALWRCAWSHEVYVSVCVIVCMLALLQLGGAGPLPMVLAGLVLLAIILLVGRLVMKVAWRLVIIAIIAVGTLYVLGLLGFNII